MNNLRRLALTAFVCTLAAVFLTPVNAAPSPSEVKRIKLIDNNHLPQKVFVVDAGHNRRFVRDLFNVIKEINLSEQLVGDEIIKLHIIPSGSDPIKGCGISPEDAKNFVEVSKIYSTSDIWMQDCMELCSAVTKDNKLIPAIYDARRGRGLGRYPKALAQDQDLVYYLNPATVGDHGDYGGNIEVTPFDDILVVGNTITKPCYKMFEENGYKDRIFVGKVDWLQVGHIDEYLSFIPTAWAPGGYSIVKADPILALDLIRNCPPEELEKVSHYDKQFLLKVQALLKKQMTNPDAGKGTAEGDFIALNYTVSDYINDTVGELKKYIVDVTGKPRDFEEVAWPCLFEGRNPSNPRNCHAFLPGVVNLLVLRDHLIVPATHVPAFDKVILARLRAQGNKVHFVDDTPYHTSMGEIHCGTNTLRNPHKVILTKKRLEAIQKTRRTFNEIYNKDK